MGPRVVPAIRASRRESVDRRLDLAGRPGGITVQRFYGYKAAGLILLGGPFALLLAGGGSPDRGDPRRRHRLVLPGHVDLARRARAPGADRARAAGLPRHPRRDRARRPRLPARARARRRRARGPGRRGDDGRAAPDGARRQPPRRVRGAARPQRLRAAAELRRRPAAGRGARRAAVGGAQRHRGRHAPGRPPGRAKTRRARDAAREPGRHLADPAGHDDPDRRLDPARLRTPGLRSVPGERARDPRTRTERLRRLAGVRVQADHRDPRGPAARHARLAGRHRPTTTRSCG